jgi:uncharacterized protein YbjT (DUF2867 family)
MPAQDPRTGSTTHPWGLANHASTRSIEAALYASAPDFTILQPAVYMQALDGAFEQALGGLTAEVTSGF